MNAPRAALRMTGWLAAALLASASFAAHAQAWQGEELAKALSSADRPQEDRARDADRKPAQVMQLLGVQRGMTALDLIAGGGYLTEVLSIAVGPQGKVFMQNPPGMGSRVGTRLDNNRLANVVPVEGNLPNAGVPAGSVDVAITAMNFHDVYNRGGAQAGEAFLKNVFDALKPGGALVVIDHAGNPGADNATLHRVPKDAVIAAAKAVGFTVDVDSNILANPADDRTKGIREEGLRGKTDQFALRLRKAK